MCPHVNIGNTKTIQPVYRAFRSATGYGTNLVTAFYGQLYGITILNVKCARLFAALIYKNRAIG